MDINVVTLVGRLTKDIETKKVGDTMVGSFTLAVNKRVKDKDVVNYFDCVVWGGVNDVLSQYTKKGTRIGIVGSLQQDRWEKDGQKQSKIKINVSSVQLLDSKPNNSSKQDDTTQNYSTEISYAAPNTSYPENEEDIF